MTTKYRYALSAGVALSVSLATLVGCGSSPTSVPTSTGGDAASAGANGGAANLGPDTMQGDSQYTVKSVALKFTNASASVNAGSAHQAYDGNVASCWGSGSASNPWISFDLGSSATISTLGVKVNPNVGTYNIQVSNDGSSWSTAVSGAKNTSWNVESKSLPSGTTGRYVRLQFVNNYGKQIMVFEVQPQGTTGGTAPAPSSTPAPSGSSPASGGSTAPSTGPSAPMKLTATGSSGYSPANAVDGNITTCWASGSVSNPSLTVDMGSTQNVTSLGFKMSPVGTYAVDMSTDGKTWTTKLTNQSNSDWNVETKNLSGTARYLRFRFTNGGKQVMVFEVQPKVSASAPSSGGGTPSTAPSTAPVSSPSTAPSTAPVSNPTPVGTTAPSGNGVAIVVSPNQVLFPADSHVLGTCRNHVSGQFPNGPAVLQAMKALTPTWGERKFLYRVGHGITDGRNDYSYMTGFHFLNTFNQTTSYPYDDIRGALNEADTMGADQMHVVNFGTSTPTEAAQYVSYLNHAGDSNRSKYPVAQQNVGMFELGNEISWSMERGHSQYAANETSYAQRAKQFAQAMRAASDVPIKIGAVAGTNSSWTGDGWSGGATTVKNILTTMGSDVDFLIYHGYPSWPVVKSGDLQTVMAQNAWNDAKITNEIEPAIKQYGGGRDIRIANTEFSANLYSDATHMHGMFGALYDADSVTLALRHNMMSAIEFCFVHPGNADSEFFLNGDPSQPTAIYKFQQMLAQHFGDSVVASSGQNIPTKSVAGASTSVSMPELSFVASKSGSTVYVMVTNRTNDTNVASSVNVGFTPSHITAYTLGDSSGWDGANGSVTTSTPSSLNNITFNHATTTILQISQ
ncbi:MAG TPA: discoidin domain-containing protein [Oscillatoriaceae cyanobacterium]